MFHILSFKILHIQTFYFGRFDFFKIDGNGKVWKFLLEKGGGGGGGEGGGGGGGV